MPKFMQIIDIDRNGSEVILHPETDADYIVKGKTFQVPTIVRIDYWNDRGIELENARKGQPTLKAKIDLIDNALRPADLLASIKTVDGSGSGLDADFLDGRTVDDTKATANELWTAFKVKTEVDKKVNNVDVVSTATANKLLRLNADGNLETNITKNAATATRLFSPITINLGGDVSGRFSFNGTEGTINVNVQVDNDSHEHTKLISNQAPVSLSSNGDKIVDFKSKDVIIASIDSKGKFSGDSNSVNGVSINNDVIGNTLWTSQKIKDHGYVTSDEVLETVENELLSYSTVTESQATFGPFTMYKGEISIAGKNSITIPVPENLQVGIFNENYIINSELNTLTFVRTPGTNTLVFNETPPTNSTISWYVMGV